MRGSIAKFIRKHVPAPWRSKIKAQWKSTPKNARPQLRELIKSFTK